MARIGEMLESKYLKQSDIMDEAIVTIRKVGKANIAKEGDEPEYKWLIRYDEFDKPMVLNKTNIKRLAKACESDDSDGWVGKRVRLYVDPDVEFGGETVGGLRISAQKILPKSEKAAEVAEAKKGHFDDMKDDIPF